MLVTIEADGGSRGNPGIAGYGAVVLGESGDVLAERASGIGRATNNVAEYRGLIAGLQAAAELGATQVRARLDSKLVVEQMSGRWKVKHPDMIPLAAQARALAAKFDSVSFTWIPRAENGHADRLANAAMDGTWDQGAAAPATREPAKAADSSPGWTGAVGQPTRFLLLRHGQTPLSVDRRYSGRGNPELTELGRAQAAGAAERLAAQGGIDVVVSSPLARARATAEAAAQALGLSVQIDHDLIETDFGAWEGLTFREAMAADPELHRTWLGDPSTPPPGGESFAAVQQRVTRARKKLCAEHPGQTVLLVSHVTPIKMVLREALDAGPALLYKLHLDLASLSVAEFYADGGTSVRLVNDTSHLR
ncbi:bifunctional RNase H/acid phosphatase [Tomitella biformata]|uniref:bifunctional RNase H/acid phosphatase n=1 Tax=Tomitella biformata TaxID=630403 RepID=UPI000465CCF2|nr:bifunctional RNase H/acid phosphatase [Tomitella biformata]